MKTKLLFPLITVLIVMITNITIADVTLTIDPDTLCIGSTDNVITLNMDNREDVVSALQIPILFDTTCFTVIDVNETAWSDRTNVLQWKEINGGILLEMLANDQHYYSGIGPMAEIIVNVGEMCCEGEYIWDLTESLVVDFLGQEIPLSEMDGFITLAECSGCSLDVPTTEFDFGEVLIGYFAKDYIVITNLSQNSEHISVTTEGCAKAYPEDFMLDTGAKYRIYIRCYPEDKNLCEGKVTLRGCGCVDVSVSCSGGAYATISTLEDKVVFAGSDYCKILLYLINQIPIQALLTDILFDTTCFSVTGVEKTERGLDIFNYSDIEGGIRIATTGLGPPIYPGDGPLAEISFIVKTCPAGQYQWNVANSIAADELGNEIGVKEIERTIAILDGQRGDMDGNGSINIIDAFWAMRIVLDEHPGPTTRELEAADCNDDGEIDVSDVIGIVNIVLEIGTCPP